MSLVCSAQPTPEQQQLKKPKTPSWLMEFTLTDQTSYPTKILNRLRQFGEIRCLMRIWEIADEHSNVNSPLPVDDLNLHTPASQQTPDNVPPERTTHTFIEAINPLSKSSVEGKQRKKKSKESEILSGTPYRKFAVVKKKEKVSKMKGRVERQHAQQEAAQ
jgi:hypothetical protein